MATGIFMDYISDDMIVLDIGAHLGYFTCIAAKLAPKGKIYAFDVDPKCFALIERNKQLNKLENIEISTLAISDKNDKVKIQKLDRPDPGIVINTRTKNDYLEVESITIDDFVERAGITPNFIKIDVEGAEEKVLQGMKEVLKQESVIILLEIHVNHLIKYFNSNYRDIIFLLLKNNFVIENINHRLNSGNF